MDGWRSLLCGPLKLYAINICVSIYHIIYVHTYTKKSEKKVISVTHKIIYIDRKVRFIDPKVE